MSRRAVPITWALGVALVSVLLISPIGCAGPSQEIIDEANSGQKDFLLGPEDVLDIAV